MDIVAMAGASHIYTCIQAIDLVLGNNKVP